MFIRVETMVGKCNRYSRRVMSDVSVVVLLLLLVMLCPGRVAAQCGVNIAGSYTCVTPPNYWGWGGPNYGDNGQLTDGFTASAWTEAAGLFYARPSSMGWSAIEPVLLFDLGQIRPVGGIGFHTAVSPWGPYWPVETAVMVSDDGVNYYLAGVLKPEPGDMEPPLTQQQIDDALDRTPSIPSALYWYRSCPFEARGRYVGLIMSYPLTGGAGGGAGAVVLDEVEIYLGPESGMTAARPDQVFNEGECGRYSYILYNMINERLSRDISTLEGKLENVAVSTINRQKLQARLSDLDAQRLQMPVPATAGFQAILPLNDLHKEIFKVQSSLWQVQGASSDVSPSRVWASLRTGGARSTVRVWQSNRWDPLPPFEEPRSSKVEFELVMAKNSVRSDVINLANGGNEVVTVDMTFVGGLPGLDVFEAPLVDTYVYEPVACALVSLQPGAGVYSFDVEPGMTQQIWIRCSSESLSAGEYNGTIHMTTGGELVADVPASIEVLDVTLPEQLSLWLGGWDYSVHRNDMVTDDNVDQYVATLKEYGLNVPWESGGLALGTYDGSGNQITPPYRGEVDQLLTYYPNMPGYAFASGALQLISDAAIVTWAQDWASYLQGKGVSPEQVMILIQDEPHTEAQLNEILRVSLAVKQGANFKIWNDIHYADPTAAPGVISAVIAACDVQCFHIQFMLDNPQAHQTFMQTHSRPGLEWWCYGNANRVSDPYIGWALWPWFCFENGLTGANWWAFSSGGDDSWNEYFGSRPDYSPLYMTEDSVTPGKSIEAMREGAQDYEILKMLQAAKSQQPPGDLYNAMQNVVANRVPIVVSPMSRAAFPWDVPKDRSTADSVRVEALRLLDAVSP